MSYINFVFKCSSLQISIRAVNVSHIKVVRDISLTQFYTQFADFVICHVKKNTIHHNVLRIENFFLKIP